MRAGQHWELRETADVIDKVPPKVYAPGENTSAIFQDLIGRSPSLQQYADVMAELERKGLKPPGHYRKRMEKIVEEQQAASATAKRARPGELDEDTLRHAMKEELRSDVLTYLDTLSAKESAAELHRLAPKLNSADLGNLGEDWYRARFAKDGEAHAFASKDALAKGQPPITIESDRFIDSLLPNGTAVEIKSITGKLSKRDVKQLEDTLIMLRDEAEIGKAATKVTGVKYVFTRPEGLKANLASIEDLLRDYTGRFSCEVFLSDGTRKMIDSVDELKKVSGRL